MTETLERHGRTRFDRPRTLVRPGPLGRLRGKATQEHNCLEHIDRIDEFERELYTRFRR